MKYLLLCVVLLTTGCASLSKEECQSADWQIIGLEDGSRGRPMHTIGEHRRACAKVAVVPDMQAYEKGHRRGLQTYCTPQNGYRLGQSGTSYSGICSGVNEANFHMGFEEGRARFEMQRELNSVEKEKVALEKRRNDLIDELTELENALLDETLPRDQRREHLRSIRELEAEQAELDRELDHMVRRVERQARGVQDLVDAQKRQGLW